MSAFASAHASRHASRHASIRGRLVSTRMSLFLGLLLVVGSACSDLLPDLEKELEEEIPLFPSNMAVDFGVVAQGTTKSEPILIANPRSSPLEVTAEIVGDDAAYFEFSLADAAGASVTVAPRATLGIEVRFLASDLGTKNASLHLHAGGQHGEIALLGTSALDGPAIACAPDSLDLGTVLLGSFDSRSFECTNTGKYIDKVGTGNPLLIDSISSDSDAFEVSIVEDDGSPGPKTEGYLAGESFRVEVTFLPTEVGSVSAAIHLETDAVDGGTLELEVMGLGQAVGACTRTDEYEYPSGDSSWPPRFILGGVPLDRTGDGEVDQEDILLMLDGEEVPHLDGDQPVWSFDRENNVVDFMPLYIPRGKTASATYDTACP